VDGGTKVIRQTWLHRTTVLIVSCCFAMVANAAVFVSVNIAPPPLPVYAQPIAPGPGYLWTPGYWAYGPYGYYWVPGTWVLAPFVGALWTPGYWGWSGGVYLWHAGYWGPRVGYYGGINYGYGYFGVGYQGGYWRDNNFYYNRYVNNVNVTTIHNTYQTNVIAQPVSRVSYNGGPGGIARQPNAVERSVEAEHHVGFTETQQRHEELAASNRQLQASVNHGRPAIAATPAPGTFDHPNVVSARGASPAAAGGMTASRPPSSQGGTMTRAQNFNAPPARPQGAPLATYPAGPTHVAPAGANNAGPKMQGAPPHGQPHAEGGHGPHGNEDAHPR